MRVMVTIETEDGKKRVVSDPISVRLITSSGKEAINDEEIKELTDIFCSQIKDCFPNLLKQYQEKKNG